MESLMQNFSVDYDDDFQQEVTDRELISVLQRGLPLCDRPYAAIACQIGISESQLIERIGSLLKQGLIKRFGVIVRHHELGYTANAMIVWDIPDSRVHDIANSMKSHPFVTLCYRRPRRMPDWPYNLYCMIHGRDRQNVIDQLGQLISRNKLQAYSHEILFSKQRFKQRGACYSIEGKAPGANIKPVYNSPEGSNHG